MQQPQFSKVLRSEVSLHSLRIFFKTQFYHFFQVFLKLIQSGTLRMSARYAWNESDVEFCFWIVFDVSGKSLHQFASSSIFSYFKLYSPRNQQFFNVPIYLPALPVTSVSEGSLRRASICGLGIFNQALPVRERATKSHPPAALWSARRRPPGLRPSPRCAGRARSPGAYRE